MRWRKRSTTHVTRFFLCRWLLNNDFLSYKVSKKNPKFFNLIFWHFQDFLISKKFSQNSYFFSIWDSWNWIHILVEISQFLSHKCINGYYFHSTYEDFRRIFHAERILRSPNDVFPQDFLSSFPTFPMKL